MPIGKFNPFWQKAKNRNAFMRLCKEAYVPKVDWDKFRELDEEGEFENFTNTELSQKFRIIRLKRMGICYQCGKRPSHKKFSLCIECKKKFRKGYQENASS
jgi:hypothetical protein